MTPVTATDVLALRARILEQSAAFSPVAGPAGGASPDSGSAFGSALRNALQSINAVQATAGDASAAFERGDTSDIASVMLARQKAAIAFEATLQVRNKLLSAYKDIMSMPV